MDKIRNLKVNSIDDFTTHQSCKIKIFNSYKDNSDVLINIKLPIEVLQCNYEIFGINNFYMNGVLTNNYGIEHMISFIASPKNKYFIKLKLTEKNNNSDSLEEDNLSHSMYYGIYNVEKKEKLEKVARNISMNIQKDSVSKNNMYGVLLSSEDESEIEDVEFAHNSRNYRISNNSDILSSMYAGSKYRCDIINLSGDEIDMSDDFSVRINIEDGQEFKREDGEDEDGDEEDGDEEDGEDEDGDEEDGEDEDGDEEDGDEEDGGEDAEEEDANKLLLELLNSNINSLEEETHNITKQIKKFDKSTNISTN